MSKEIKEPENRFLDLSCIPEFKIKEVETEFKDAYVQKAKKILDEILSDPEVKGQIRKRILDAAKVLEEQC